ncbi:MAG: GyrI-like domain-containing protein [Spirosomataceae bacterium]
MTIKETPPFYALTYAAQTTLAGLNQFGQVIQSLCTEADRMKVTQAGDLQWNYYNIDGKPETVFTLEVALPIAEKDAESSEFALKQIPSFKCLSLIHEGPWETLPQAYEKAMGYLTANGLTMTNECREIYRTMNGDKGADNITEVQIGIH